MHFATFRLGCVSLPRVFRKCRVNLIDLFFLLRFEPHPFVIKYFYLIDPPVVGILIFRSRGI